MEFCDVCFGSVLPLGHLAGQTVRKQTTSGMGSIEPFVILPAGDRYGSKDADRGQLPMSASVGPKPGNRQADSGQSRPVGLWRGRTIWVESRSLASVTKQFPAGTRRAGSPCRDPGLVARQRGPAQGLRIDMRATRLAARRRVGGPSPWQRNRRENPAGAPGAPAGFQPNSAAHPPKVRRGFTSTSRSGTCRRFSRCTIGRA